MFQFLLGSLKIKYLPQYSSREPEFQFLLGSLKIKQFHFSFYAHVKFQFLLGSLKIRPHTDITGISFFFIYNLNVIFFIIKCMLIFIF